MNEKKLKKEIKEIKKTNKTKRFKYNANLLKKRIHITSRSNTVRESFALGVLNIQYINKLSPMPYIPHSLSYVARGTYNYVFKTRDNKLAFRINKVPIKEQGCEITNLMQEGMLTIRLSELNISPKIYDNYFCKTNKSGRNTHFVLVTEFSKYGTLDEFLLSRFCKESKISDYVIQTINLYKKMVQNFIFCNDTKPKNMIITDSLEIKIIDFDSDFCASQETKYDANIIFKSAKAITKRFFPKINDTILKEKILNGFWKLNVLQVAAILHENTNMLTDSKKTFKYVKQLMHESIRPLDLFDIIICSTIKTSALSNGYKHFKHYFAEIDIFYHINETVIKDDPITMITLAYMKCVFGTKEMNSFLYFVNTQRFEKLISNMKTKYKPRMIQNNLKSSYKQIKYEIYDSKTKSYIKTSFPPKKWNWQPSITPEDIYLIEEIYQNQISQ